MSTSQEDNQDLANALSMLQAMEAQSDSQSAEPAPASSSINSPTLLSLDESRRPQTRTVCDHCPNAVWFASPTEVKCYCRVMYLITWSSKEPNVLIECDGQYLGDD